MRSFKTITTHITCDVCGRPMADCLSDYDDFTGPTIAMHTSYCKDFDVFERNVSHECDLCEDCLRSLKDWCKARRYSYEKEKQQKDEIKYELPANGV